MGLDAKLCISKAKHPVLIREADIVWAVSNGAKKVIKSKKTSQ